jgi:hypothetical protein
MAIGRFAGEQIDEIKPLFNSDDVSGFLKDAIKTGEIVIKVTRTIDKVNTGHIYISVPYNDDLDRLGEDLLFNVKFK